MVSFIFPSASGSLSSGALSNNSHKLMAAFKTSLEAFFREQVIKIVIRL